MTHIWYLKSVPSRTGLLLDISVKKLEQVAYFASYIITEVYEDKRTEAIHELENAYKNQKVTLQKEIQQIVGDLTLQLEEKKISKKEFADLETMHTRRIDELDVEYTKLRDLLKLLRVAEVIGELDYRILYEKFPHVFK